MRDPNRIGPMVDALEEYWRAHPDLRFWQVVEFMRTRLTQDQCPGSKKGWVQLDPDFDPFYVEDEKTAKVLDRMVNNC